MPFAGSGWMSPRGPASRGDDADVDSAAEDAVDGDAIAGDMPAVSSATMKMNARAADVIFLDLINIMMTSV
jgi:hypothetical protein